MAARVISLKLGKVVHGRKIVGVETYPLPLVLYSQLSLGVYAENSSCLAMRLSSGGWSTILVRMR